MQARDRLQAESLEITGSISIFSDGSRENSDFDILEDIEKINAIVFSSEEKYHGSVNITAKSLKQFLSGNPAPDLHDASTGTGTE